RLLGTRRGRRTVEPGIDRVSGSSCPPGYSVMDEPLASSQLLEGEILRGIRAAIEQVIGDQRAHEERNRRAAVDVVLDREHDVRRYVERKIVASHGARSSRTGGAGSCVACSSISSAHAKQSGASSGS